jgi:hypothetical protein
MTTKSYAIHDNGGRPFRVDRLGNKISVWMTKTSYEKVEGTFVDVVHPPKQILEFTAEEVFVGKKSPKGGYDGLKPKDAEGNSILLHVGSKYVYIGSEIYEFQPVKGDTIVKYYSDIGNSDVPYPYAIGKTHMYMMLDKVAVALDFFDGKDDIYQQYYAAKSYLPMCLKGHQPQEMCKDKKAARDRIADLKESSTRLKPKSLQPRM